MTNKFNETARELAVAESELSDARIAAAQASERLVAAQKRHREADRLHLIEQLKREQAQ